MENEQKTTSVDQTVAQFIDAGIGLVMLPFSLAQQTFESTKESTQSKFDTLRSRGEEVESQIKDKLDPLGQRFNIGSICNQVSMMLSPRANREAQIEALSSKVDTLVELVATLAAKKAAEKKAAAPAKPKTTRRASTAASKSTTAKATTAKATTAKTAAKPAATTRKRATTKSTSTTASKPKAAPKTEPKSE